MKDEHKEFKYFGLSLLQGTAFIGVVGIVLTLVARHFWG